MTGSNGAAPEQADGTPAVKAAPRRRANSTPEGSTPSGERVAPGFVGARIRARRLRRGVSLRQFARDLDVSASFISQLETGKAQPSVATLFAICAALDITTDELFENETVTHEAPSPELAAGTDAEHNSWRTVTSFGVGPAEVSTLMDAATPGGSSPLVRPHQRKVIVLDSGVTWESLTATHADKTDFMFVRYDVGGSSTIENRLIRHVGTEYGFILSGCLEVTLGFETYRLSPGDSISFDSSRPHRLANVGDVPAEAIWFNMEFRDNP
jgi:transcriptional regulator with XRE-family HTH domain